MDEEQERARKVAPEDIFRAIAELREAEWRSGLNRGDRNKIEYAKLRYSVLLDLLRKANVL